MEGPSKRRRSIRLGGYDCRLAGEYFVTLCTQERETRFGEIRAEAVSLNAVGRMVDERWCGLPAKYPTVATGPHVVMPNHLHGIVILGAEPPDRAEAEQGPKCACGEWNVDARPGQAARAAGPLQGGQTMTRSMDRRTFVATGATAMGAALAAGRAGQAQAAFQHKLHKALIVGKPTEEALAPMKAAGFDGVEAGIVSPEEAAQAKAMAEGLGMKIHCVLRGWASFNSENADEVQAGFDQTVAALRAAQGYGAGAILLVPCRIGGMAMPEPWDFRIEFDDATGHLTRVAEGDNAPYADYIAAHDRAYDTSREQIEKLIPVAEETGVVIGVENVWNNLFIDPRHLAHFVDGFGSEWVQVYFDLGNHVKYSPTEQWVRVLGQRIVRCHVKDFKLNPDGHGGSFVDIRDGSVNWPVVRQALDDVGYEGWMTIEGSGGLSLEEQSRRLDQIIAGE